MKHLSLLFFILLSNIVFGQSYIEGGNTRHRFAQMTLGFDSQYFSGNNTSSKRHSLSNKLESYQLRNYSNARIIIGGTHFWGHADFNIAIPIITLLKSEYKTGVETSFRYIPLRIENNKIRPFIGVSLLNTKLKINDGATRQRFKFPISTGLIYNRENHLFEIGFGYNYDFEEKYYINKFTEVSVKTQAFYLTIGYKIMFETTLGAEKDWESGRTEKITEKLAKSGQLNGITIAIGPSSTFFLKESNYNKDIAPFIDNHKDAIFPEFAIGYYLHKPDLQFNLVYRGLSSKIEAYDFKQSATRKALTFETYKFFADYHGFAPFIGPSISYEILQVHQNSQSVISTENFKGVRAGITFGWDIRPNRIQSFYLRTHLRYFPNLSVDMKNGKSVPFNQLEFNFIELILFPNRLF